MADQTVSALTEISSVATSDALHIVSGGASYKTTVTKLADGVLDATVFDGAGTGGTAVTILSRLRQRISPLEYGAAADGVTNDATAIQNAINAAASSGKIVDLGGRSYAVTSALSISSSRMVIRDGYIAPSGTFDLFTFSGGMYGGALDNIVSDCTSLTGRFVVIDNANRTTLRDIICTAPLRFAYVRKANTTNFHNVYCSGIRGSYFTTWYGDASNRSDILRFVSVTCGFGSSAGGYGLDWDGNCHSFSCANFGVVGSSGTTNVEYGVRIRNTAGSTAPAIGRFMDLEVDYPNNHAISIEAGSDYHIVGGYMHGSSTGSGLYVASGITARTVSVGNSKLTGHARYGIETTNAVLAANNNMSSNSLGDLSGPASAFIIPNRGIQVSSGNLEIIGDSTDYQSYDATNNRWNFYIGGTSIMQMRSTGTILNTLPTSSAGLPTGTIWNDGGTLKVA